MSVSPTQPRAADPPAAGGCASCGLETHAVALDDFGPDLTGQLCPSCGLVHAEVTQ